jgi:hypothetical protein
MEPYCGCVSLIRNDIDFNVSEIQKHPKFHHFVRFEPFIILEFLMGWDLTVISIHGLCSFHHFLCFCLASLCFTYTCF